jgi:serine/threonine protein kinase
VAVKRFKMHHSDDLNRFRRELRILASLAGHPNIVPVLGARALPPDYLMVMPLASTTLHGKMYQLGWRPNTVELLHLALQAAEGLAAVHAQGMVHRDLKPSNMLLSYEGQLWLADFGLAASVEEVAQESTLSVRMVRSRGKPTGERCSLLGSHDSALAVWCMWYHVGAACMVRSRGKPTGGIDGPRLEHWLALSGAYGMHACAVHSREPVVFPRHCCISMLSPPPCCSYLLSYLIPPSWLQVAS